MLPGTLALKQDYVTMVSIGFPVPRDTLSVSPHCFIPTAGMTSRSPRLRTCLSPFPDCQPQGQGLCHNYLCLSHAAQRLVHDKPSINANWMDKWMNGVLRERKVKGGRCHNREMAQRASCYLPDLPQTCRWNWCLHIDGDLHSLAPQKCRCSVWFPWLWTFLVVMCSIHCFDAHCSSASSAATDVRH